MSDQFKPSKFTIQLKLILITFTILVASLSSIIVLATFFFKRDSENRIRENNIKITELLSMKLTADLESNKKILTLIADRMLEKEKIQLDEKEKIISVMILKENDNSMEAISSYLDEKKAAEKNLKLEDIQYFININAESYKKSFSGSFVLENASPLFNYPVFGISFPYKNIINENSIIVCFMKSDDLLEAFSTSGTISTYLVDDSGTILAHPERDKVITAFNYSNLQIVKEMLNSQTDNNQIEYKDENGENNLGSFKKLKIISAGVISTIQTKVAFEEVYNLQRRNIYMMIAVLNFAFLIVYFFAKQMTKPIKDLVGATKEVETGNFRPNVNITSKDEIGILTHSFIQMGIGLEEREKVKSILGNMIDPTVVEEAMKDMAALKRGSEKEITAFFSDVASFSTISEKLKSVDLASVLNEYLSAMTIILKKYDGVLDKYIGDAIVGIFNAPIEVSEHEIKAAKASIDMIQKLSDLRDFWTKNNKYIKEAQEMDVRIGLNCGLAKVGFMGTEALASYTMMGDTVNLAARLEAAGKDYGVNILISEMLNKKVSHEMFTRELDIVRVKGKNEPVKLYELISLKSDLKPNLKEAAEIYKEGFELYLKREWEKSIAIFEKVSKAKGSKDKASEQIIERCNYFLNSPPEADWDGVFTRKHK